MQLKFCGSVEALPTLANMREPKNWSFTELFASPSQKLHQ